LYFVLRVRYVVVGKTTESDRQANYNPNPTANPNPKRYLLTVQYGGLASS